MAIGHFRVAQPLYRGLHLLFARLTHGLSSSRLLRLAPMRVVEWVVDLPAHPQAVQEHRELPRCGHHRPLLGVLATPGGYFLPVAPQVRIGAEGSQDVVGAAYQEPTLSISSPSLEMCFWEPRRI